MNNKAIKTSLTIIFSLLLIISIVLSLFFLEFKMDYKTYIEKYSKKFEVEDALIYAIIKAESKYNKNAISNKNAIGLMQIKLSTANYIENTNKLTQNDLLIPEKNIEIGTKYLSYLLNKFKNLETSICAYNAGETTVKEWLNCPDYSKDGITISNIPFAQTRNYLKKVMLNLKIYRKIIN